MNACVLCYTETFAKMETDRNSSGNYSEDSDVLYDLTEDMLAVSIPVLCFILLLMIMGTAGNSLVICTYVKRVVKSSTNLFIFSLAIFDLINCTIALPLEVYTLMNPYTNNHTYMCKFHRFINFAADLSSGFIIVCISFDRYLRIARPHQGLSVKGSKIAILVTCLLSSAVSSLALVVYGTRTVQFDEHPEIHGHECGISDSNQDTIVPLLFTTTILVTFVVGVIILLTVYTMLGIKVKRWSRGRKSKQARSARSSEYFQAAVISDDTESPDTPEPRVSETFTFMPPNTNKARDLEPTFKRPEYVRELSRSLDKSEFLKCDATCGTGLHMNGTQTLPLRKPRRQASTIGRKSSMPSLYDLKRRMKVSRTTVMFISATVAFVASHLPFACIKIARTLNLDLTKHMSHVGYSFFLFAEYSFIVSYAVNPIIYSFLNPKFRRECKSLLADVSKTIKCRSKKFYFR